MAWVSCLFFPSLLEGAAVYVVTFHFTNRPAAAPHIRIR